MVLPPIEKGSGSKFKELLWVIAIVLLIFIRLACHTLKTYAYPVIQQRSEACWQCQQSSGLFIFWGTEDLWLETHKARQKYKFSSSPQLE
ncbi:MAG: hypothetical protein EAZ94_20525 [Oscillatoriales cyanobacterium]|nr:MAG: hypothetical protein EAZ94_20525 [Oscillatoriales cyanobacterium]TAE21439.1 MAG: hypothetical protein EAZ93_20530 [Oscillatoriales cyanobacterium]